MRPFRFAAAALAAIAAAAATAHGDSVVTSQRVACVDGHCVVETSGGAGVQAGSEAGGADAVQRSSVSTVTRSSGGATAVATVSVSGSGGKSSVVAQATATSPPGPSLTVRMTAARLAALLADRAPLIEVSADRATAVEIAATLLWRPSPGRRERVVLLRRELEVDGVKPRRLRLGASARGLARLPRHGKLTLRVTGRAPQGATVSLQLRA